MAPQRLHAEFHYPWLHHVQRHLLTFRDCIKPWNILATDDHKAVLFDIEATTAEQYFLLWLQGVAVGSHDHHLLGGIKGTCHGRALDHGRHEHWLRSNLPRQNLEGHHETAIACDRAHTALLQELDAIGKPSLHLLCELPTLCHLEAQARNDSIEDIIAKAGWAISVTFSRRVIVVQADDTQGWVFRLGFRRRTRLPSTATKTSVCQHLAVGVHQLFVRLHEFGVGLPLLGHDLYELGMRCHQLAQCVPMLHHATILCEWHRHRHVSSEVIGWHYLLTRHR
mmetsp:Transcript_7503/g.13495  ORF Transcript_7503/g.13495 Transcript_7503/m.13495 type:complete len:281 (+) Transcript_7503:1335-2177(+)